MVLRLDCISDIYDRGIDWRERYQSEPYSTVMEAKKNGFRFYAKRYRAFNQNSQSPEVTGQSERLPTLMLTAYRNKYGYLTRNGLTQMTVDILPPKTVGKAPILYYTEDDYYIGDKRKSRLCGGPPRPRCYNEVRSLLMG